MAKEIRISTFTLSNKKPLVLIAGPCVIEGERFCLDTARELKKIAKSFNMPFVFKASYDKANRSSISSFRGPGLKKGLRILSKVKAALDIPVISDVHCTAHVKDAASVLDIIQIPAFLSRQTDLLIAAAKTKKPVNIKKGQFLAPWDIIHAIKKVTSSGNKNVLITERGSSFGYNNLVSDMRSLALINEIGYPVIYDATHSVQLPGGSGAVSAGESKFIPALSRAAVAVGCAGLFLEVHPYPRKARSDAANMLNFSELKALLKEVIEIDQLIKHYKSEK